MWQLPVVLAVAYAAVVALAFLFQSRLVYFPGVGREASATPQAIGLRYEPVEIVTEDGERLAAWWVPAENALGTVLFFHGNAGNMSHRLEYLAMFHGMRYATLIVDYRGYGRSTGAPSEEGTYRDARASWEYLRHARLAKPRDIVIVGESLGGAVAAWLAARISLTPGPSPDGRGEANASLLPLEGPGMRGPRAVVLASTFTSVPDLGARLYPFLPVRMIARIRYDTLAAVAAISAPVLIAHSPGDDIIPYRHGRSLFEAARGPKRFLELAGGHNEGFLYTRGEWRAQLAAFLDGAGTAVR